MNFKQIISFWCSVLIIGGVTDSVSAQSLQTEPVPSALSCGQSFSWKIGVIDPRFDIDREAVKSIMQDVSDLWSNAAGSELIAYSDTGQVTINFIYGKEQQFTDTERQLSARINKMKFHQFTLEKDYKQLFYTHENKRALYDSLRIEFLKKVDNYNWTIARNGDTGVVQKLEKDRLIRLRETIEKLDEELKSTENKLNEEAKKLKQLSTLLENVTEQVNKLIFNYNDRFGSPTTFYQGVYIDDLNHKKINIYEFESLNKLKLVLAHEVGHALGIGHVNNPKSIMYFKMEKQIGQNLQLSEEDVRAMENRCGAKLAQ